jgi:hypothetical protein
MRMGLYVGRTFDFNGILVPFPIVPLSTAYYQFGLLSIVDETWIYCVLAQQVPPSNAPPPNNTELGLVWL